MKTSKWEIRPLIPVQLQPQEWVALNQFSNQMQVESLPDDPPIPLEQTIQLRSNIPPVLERATWAAWDTTAPDRAPRLLAEAFSQIINMPENAHIAQVQINVLPEVRRQGLGSGLLALCADFAQKMNRRLLLLNSNTNCPAAEPFLRGIGAEIGVTAEVNQLKLAELDRTLVNAWLERAAQNAHKFELGFWDGAYPEEEFEQIVIVKTAMDQAPTGDLEVEPIRWTPEILKQMDENMLQRHITRWTYYIRERASGSLAGFTEMFWFQSDEIIAHQGDTGVLEAYRNQGLGRWLKAAMLQKVLNEKPAARFVRTGNATTNAPMLKINHELGFRLYCSQHAWQVETRHVLAHLETLNVA